MVNIFQFNYNNKKFRVRYDSPVKENVGTCLLIQSGQSGRYDEATPEALFYERLTESLNSRQIGVLRLDMETREDLQAPANSKHLSERTDRIGYLLRELSVNDLPSPSVLCGISLGAQSIIKLISSSSLPIQLLGVVLIGCVIEEPITIMNNLHTIQFIYGGRDYIAYIDSNSNEIVPIPPEEYGQKSCKLLILRSWQTCGVSIYENLGHFLLNDEESGDNNYAVLELCNSVEKILHNENPQSHIS